MPSSEGTDEAPPTNALKDFPTHEEFFELALAVKPDLRVTISSLQALILLQWYLYTEVGFDPFSESRGILADRFRDLFCSDTVVVFGDWLGTWSGSQSNSVCTTIHQNP